MNKKIKSMAADALDYFIFTWVFAGMAVLATLPFLVIAWAVWLLFR